ncbi:hypothetical protein [Clostridium sp. C2-6-12]|uniref:hypothetical protein n=1 Tax=Clostridium sp. C2-6-12 TaxID=2698832 RepID=UPI00136ACEFB|nr:hypothetical protein [Clostridium sp. C2-6-12]
MNKKAIKIIISSFIFINLLSTFHQTTIADDSQNSSDNSIETSIENIDNLKDDKKENLKGFSLFDEENYRYLSSEQKKDLLNLRKCKENGEKLSTEQEQTLKSIIDCIIKGKLGNTDYKEYKTLIEKKKAKTQLTEKEELLLKEYNDIINGYKLSTKEILNQFLRQ